MSQFIFTGEEYVNVDHIVTIDTCPHTKTIWIRPDTGEKYARSIKFLDGILDDLECRKRTIEVRRD